MPKDDKNEFLKALNVDGFASENDIKKAYKKLALQCHPDKNFSEVTAKKQFEELSKAFESLLLDEANNSINDCDQIFFDFLGEILFGSESNSDFFSFFCGSKQHCCLPSDGDIDHRYHDDYDEEDIDGESELDSIMEIIKNRRKNGKSVPDTFHEEKLQELKNMLVQHKEDMKKDNTKKQQTSKKGKTTVPVAKPKPKSKKQLLAEQRRRDKEMQQIAVQLEEKRKEDEEKDKQRKQMEIERQKRLEEERIKTQNEERKRREREQKEREKQQRQEQEKEERRRRQQEEEKKRKEEEEKRKKAEKEKAEKEKAAKKAALQAAKEKEEQAKSGNKLQSAKRQPQQQRTDQQQYPREIPPRFQKMKKQQLQQQQQQHMQQSQSTSYQPNQQNSQPQPQQQQQQQQQQNRAQIKPQPPVGKKKDPNRFASKEYSGIINEVDDLSWPKGQAGGSGWVGSTEDWDQETDKWGAVDKDWGGKERTSWQKVVDRTDNNTWPAVGTKTTNDTTTTNTLNLTISKTSSVNSNALLQSDSKSRNVLNSNSLNSQQTKDWTSTSSSTGLDTWDSACDDSIDRALDAADTKHVVPGAAGGVGWGGMGTGGLGGLIGTPLGWDPAGVSSKSDTPNDGKQGWTSNASAAGLDSLSWSKTPGKGPKIKPNTELDNKKLNVTTSTSTWGGTPADSSSAWVEHSKKSEKSATWDTDTNSTNLQTLSSGKTSSESSDKLKPGTESSGWGDGAGSWGTAPDITGTACWDNALNVRKVTDIKDAPSNKGWLENSASSSNANIADKEETNDSSWDGWTTASKRNRAPKPAPPTTTNTTDSNAWMSRSLKQLLDMGFKQEDADKALRANHMNIESAIGDLLSMTASTAETSTSNATTTSTPKDQEPSTDSNALQQQAQVKQNRKQRRKIQQQQQQQQNTVTNLPTSQENQLSTEACKQLTTATTATTTTAPQTTDTDTTTRQPANKIVKPSVKPNTVHQSTDKPKVSPTAEQSNPQAPKPIGATGHPVANAKRGATGLMQPPTPGVPTPIRTISHPLLQQQLMHQYHLMRMGGLLQSQLTPQQFALFQQMAQLRIVQQGLAQQQLSQKHAIGVQAQQQLYQQQQQITLMIAQMQQQLLQQQQPAQASRFPTPGFPHNNVPSQPSHATATGNPQQHKNSKPPEKPTSEAQPVNSENPPEVSQAKDVSANVPVEERTKQASPVPQSRLTQWKQPLLPNPDQQPLSTEPPKEWSSSANTSPKPNRMSESVSSRWGVDASPRLSADPPEFKPGVPWRPRNDEEKISPREEEKPSDKSLPPQSISPSSPSKQRGTFNEGAELSGQYTFGIGSSPWQSTGPNDSLLNKPSSLRPPPGLDSQNVFPESSKMEEAHSSWVENLIGGAPPTFAQNGPTKDFNFGQLSFPITGSSWSTQDGQLLAAPDPKPWAAPGGPSSSTTTPSVVPMATSVGQASNTINATPTPDVTKATSSGISSWSANQPIPSAEEKLSHKRPLLGGDPGKAASLSTWLVLRNIPPNADINAIRKVCQQHGQLLIFQYNMRYGNSLIRYGSKDQAATIRNLLNGMTVQGGQLSADFATNSDIAAFFEQPVDWPSNQLPTNSNYGNNWTTFPMGQGDASQSRPNVVLNHDNKQPTVPQSTVVPPGSMSWGNAGPTPNPSQLWGAPLPGNNTGFPTQGPSMWSFGGSQPESAPTQSGGDSGGLVSPSMTTFLPPGLLNGGESV